VLLNLLPEKIPGTATRRQITFSRTKFFAAGDPCRRANASRLAPAIEFTSPEFVQIAQASCDLRDFFGQFAAIRFEGKSELSDFLGNSRILFSGKVRHRPCITVRNAGHVAKSESEEVEGATVGSAMNRSLA
jgi:hypothetical protein